MAETLEERVIDTVNVPNVGETDNDVLTDAEGEIVDVVEADTDDDTVSDFDAVVVNDAETVPERDPVYDSVADVVALCELETVSVMDRLRELV